MKIPDLLWHYTSVASFINIVKSQEIWAFSAYSMWSDDQEITFGASLLDEAALELASERPELSESLYMLSRRKFIESQLKNVFVFSTTSNPESDHQWREFADNHTGVAFALSPSMRLAHFSHGSDERMTVTSHFITPTMNGWYPVVYEHEEHITLLKQAMLDGPALARNGGRFSLGNNLFRPISTAIGSIKRPDYRSENEVRLLLSTHRTVEPQLLPGSERAYLSMGNFDRERFSMGPLDIRQVRVGRDAEINLDDVSEILKSGGITNCVVTRQGQTDA